MTSGFRVPDVDLSAVLQPVCLSLFTAANSTSLDAITPEVGGAWTEQSGDWDIQGNRANPDGVAFATVDSGESDCILDCVCNAAATSAPGILARYTDNTHCWEATIYTTAVDMVQIWEFNGGATKRAETAVTITPGVDYDVRFICDGQVYSAFVDGGNKVTYTDATDFNKTETLCGLRATGTADEFDNFAIFPRTSSMYDATLNSV